MRVGGTAVIVGPDTHGLVLPCATLCEGRLGCGRAAQLRLELAGAIWCICRHRCCRCGGCFYCCVWLAAASNQGGKYNGPTLPRGGGLDNHAAPAHPGVDGAPPLVPPSLATPRVGKMSFGPGADDGAAGAAGAGEDGLEPPRCAQGPAKAAWHRGSKSSLRGSCSARAMQRSHTGEAVLDRVGVRRGGARPRRAVQ